MRKSGNLEQRMADSRALLKPITCYHTPGTSLYRTLCVYSL
jgi:hypothetical protein